MFRNGGPRARGDECGDRRNVERGHRPAPRPARVHEVGPGGPDREHGGAQRAGGTRHLIGGLPFGTEPHQQGGDLGGARLTTHHDTEHLGGEVFGERLTVRERVERLAKRRGIHRVQGAEAISATWPLSNSDNGLHLSRVTSRPHLAVIQYDGARFAGWQRQPDARTVQAEFETVLQRLDGGDERIVTTGAGRTDAGVHALGQGVSFTPGARWDDQPSTELRRALNALLPDDVWVERVYAMRPGFDARRSATARRYRYVIGTDEAAASPFRRPYEWALSVNGNRPLDIAALRDASALLAGEHDFRGLAAAGAATAHYRCRVALAEWAPRTDEGGGGVTFTIEADRFLHHMVRFLVGTMVDIALGRRPPADFPRLLEATDNLAASPPAPPHGLYLMAVRYPPELYAEACS